MTNFLFTQAPTKGEIVRQVAGLKGPSLQPTSCNQGKGCTKAFWGWDGGIFNSDYLSGSILQKNCTPVCSGRPVTADKAASHHTTYLLQVKLVYCSFICALGMFIWFHGCKYTDGDLSSGHQESLPTHDILPLSQMIGGSALNGHTPCHAISLPDTWRERNKWRMMGLQTADIAHHVAHLVSPTEATTSHLSGMRRGAGKTTTFYLWGNNVKEHRVGSCCIRLPK